MGRPRLLANGMTLAEMCMPKVPAAVQKLFDLLKSTDENVLIKAIQIILERACGKPMQLDLPQAEDTRMRLTDLTRDQVLQIRQRMDEILALPPPETKP